MVALGSTQFALTAENDGFLLDLAANEIATYFCYLPPLPEPGADAATQPVSISQSLQLEGVAVKQRTESVAYNPDNAQLFAQPRTFRMDTGTVAGSELFVFGAGGGEPIQVLPLPRTLVAGGMVAAAGSRLILGARNALYEITLSGVLTLLRELEPSVDITGLARATNGDIWILDGTSQRLLKTREAF